MNTLLHDYMRVKRGCPCPVCNHRSWCLIERRDPYNPAQVICARIESDFKWGTAGWLHTLREEPDRHPLFIRGRRVEMHRPSALDFAALAAEFRSAVDRVALSSLCVALGLTAGSLERLGVGWASREALAQVNTTCGGAGAWTFPMLTPAGEAVGIRLRIVGGYKYAITGSRQGLFIPAGVGKPDRLLLAEGATDTAALLDLGFMAAGRPSCSGGEKHCVGLVRRLRPREVVVVSDADEPGQNGATALATTLRTYAPTVKVIRPPAGVKDARAWKGTTHDQAAVKQQVEEAIDAAVPVAARILVKAGGR